MNTGAVATLMGILLAITLFGCEREASKNVDQFKDGSALISAPSTDLQNEGNNSTPAISGSGDLEKRIADLEYAVSTLKSSVAAITGEISPSSGFNYGGPSLERRMSALEQKQMVAMDEGMDAGAGPKVSAVGR